MYKIAKFLNKIGCFFKKSKYVQFKNPILDQKVSVNGKMVPIYNLDEKEIKSYLKKINPDEASKIINSLQYEKSNFPSEKMQMFFRTLVSKKYKMPKGIKNEHELWSLLISPWDENVEFKEQIYSDFIHKNPELLKLYREVAKELKDQDDLDLLKHNIVFGGASRFIPEDIKYFSTRSWENFKKHLDTMESHHFDGNGWIPSPETYKHSYFYERSQYAK